MFYFFFLFIIFILFCLQGSLSNKGLSYTGLVLSILFSGLSFKNGWDLNTYIEWYELVGNTGYHGFISLIDDKYVEAGFASLFLVLNQMLIPYVIFTFLFALGTNILYFKFCNVFKLNYLLFLLLFFVTSYTRLELSTLRQGIAVAIIVYSFKFIISSNLKKYLLFCVVAGLFHRTAFLLIFLYRILKGNHNSRTHYNCFIIGLIVFVMLGISGFGIPIITKILSFLQSGSSSIFINKFIYYIKQDVQLFNFQRLLLALFYFVFICFRLESKSYNFFLNLLGVHFFLNFYLFFMPNVFLIRLEYYFIFGWIGLLVMHLSNKIKRSSTNSYIIVLFLFLFVNIKLALLFKSENDRKVYFPYRHSLESIIRNMDDVRSQHEINDVLK